MIQSAKHLLTACCSGLSVDVRYSNRRGEISELAEDFSSYRIAKGTELPTEQRDSQFYEGAFDSLELPLRSPMYLISGESSSGEWSENGTISSSDRIIDWIYPTKKLLSSSVQYHVFYLGERECEQESGQAAVNETNILLCSEYDHESTRVVLRINASNIKIIDPINDSVMKKFHIHAVSFAAQDSNTETVFSFITVERGGRLVCHSFLCNTIKHAERVLMALGQAFEVAYQLRNSSLTPRTNIRARSRNSVFGSLSRTTRSGTTCSSIKTCSSRYANAPTLPKTTYWEK